MPPVSLDGADGGKTLGFFPTGIGFFAVIFGLTETEGFAPTMTGFLATSAGFTPAIVGFFGDGIGLAADGALDAFSLACNSANLFAFSNLAAFPDGGAGAARFLAATGG